MMQSESPGGTVDPAEVAKFARLAATWWDPEGPMKPLHRFNPVRLEYLRDRLAAQAGRDPLGPLPLSGLKVLDLGCGGGLVTEPLARLGAEMTGIDATPDSIAVARQHAEAAGLTIDYQNTTAEALVERGAHFDAVLALEIIEHVADVPAFLAACAQLVKPGGQLILSTLNRTAKAFALAIVGAEYVLRWLPRGTHDWKKFLKPSEIATHLRPLGLEITELQGTVYQPWSGRWRLDTRDLNVNYMLRAGRP